MPYFGYARQDRRSKARTPISAKLVANLLTEAGIERVLTLDLHAAQIQGFFDIPVDNLYAAPVFALDIRHNFRNLARDHRGLARRRRRRRARASSPSASTPSSPSSTSAAPAPGEVASMTVIGEVRDRVCVIVDDICDTAGTLVKAAELLIGAGRHARCTPTSPTACSRARRSSGSTASAMKSLVITDSIEPTPAVRKAQQHPHRAGGAAVRPGDPEHRQRHQRVVAVRLAHARADLRGALPRPPPDAMVGLVFQGVLLGLGATIVMDIWTVVLSRLQGQTLPDWAPVGRWFWHLGNGQLFHDDIARAEPYARELALGWIGHYVVGILYGVIFALIVGPGWLAHPSFPPA